jgi:hypothetical protein
MFANVHVDTPPKVRKPIRPTPGAEPHRVAARLLRRFLLRTGLLAFGEMGCTTGYGEPRKLTFVTGPLKLHFIWSPFNTHTSTCWVAIEKGSLS